MLIMCENCWINYGSPEISSRRVRRAAEAISNLYEFTGAGGALHIAVEDWNLDDASIEFCINFIDDPSRSPGFPVPAAQIAAEKKCAEVLRKLTIKERASALAIHRGYFNPP